MIKPKLVLVDDEERILRSLTMLFRPHYDLFTSTDARTALAHICLHPVHVVVSDQRMPGMRGSELLAAVRSSSPATMRILLTGYSEREAIVSSVNEGEIFRFVTKPWQAGELLDTVRQAAEIALSTGAAAAARGAAPLDAEEAILVLDDDAAVVAAVQEAAGPTRPVHWARSIEEALDALRGHRIAVLVADLFVGREPVAVALKMLKAEYSQLTMIVMTSFQDTSALIGLINQGQVFRFLPKPIGHGPLGAHLASALRHHHRLVATPALTRRHVAQGVPADEDGSVAARVRGYFARLRARPVSG